MEKTVYYKLSKGRIDEATLFVSCCKLGSYLTEGTSCVEQFKIRYSKELKDLAVQLQKSAILIKSKNTCAIATLQINGKEFTTDTSIWPKIGEVISRFVALNEAQSTDIIKDNPKGLHGTEDT